jgi:hypothetical protein
MGGRFCAIDRKDRTTKALQHGHSAHLALKQRHNGAKVIVELPPEKCALICVNEDALTRSTLSLGRNLRDLVVLVKRHSTAKCGVGSVARLCCALQ